MTDFPYLKPEDIYLDSACQSLRPQPVLDSMQEYYTEHNSCGERVKYQWGIETDRKVEQTRTKVLKFLKLSHREYFVSFTLNTTYGINLLLSQLDCKKANIRKVITSDIEHNSPFLATISFAEQNNLIREVITRLPDGSMPLSSYQNAKGASKTIDFGNSIVVVNCVSNIDGRKLNNLKELIKTVHKAGGIIIIDAAQAMAHHVDILQKTDADAICFSAHKMYGPSLGVIVAKKKLTGLLKPVFLGGGMVDDVEMNRYYLSSENPDHIYTRFEPGLQAWSEIIGLGAALDWLSQIGKENKSNLIQYTAQLQDFLNSKSNIHLLGASDSPTMSFYVDGIDSHLLGGALADQGIMARTGYFCVHYYLDHVLHLPPLVRFSLGYHTRQSDIDQVIAALQKV